MLAKIFAVATCAFAALVSAQGKLQFTQVPANAEVGQPTTITWTGGDGSPVTLTLREGDPNNLATIAIITGSASGTSFTWTPSTDIPPADDYALQISQGESSINYSGFFSILGGSAPVSTTVVAIGSSTTIPLTTLSPNTTSVTATTSVSVTAILTGTGSVGTGTTISRNTTFVSQTLSATGTATGSAGTITATSSLGGATTAASSSSAPVASTGAAAALKAQVGMGVGAFAAALFML